MHKPFPLLASVLILLGLLGHHFHSPVLPDHAAAAPAAVHVADSAPGATGSTLRIVDHGALLDIDVEVCVPGGQASHLAVTGASDVAILPVAVHGEVVYPAPSATPAWLVPAFPPDILRAFLQVYLN